jgi:hypothetical protein
MCTLGRVRGVMLGGELRTLLFDILSLAWPCALGDFAGEECQLSAVSMCPVPEDVLGAEAARQAVGVGGGSCGAADVRIRRRCLL